jgi:hypothetical protein
VVYWEKNINYLWNYFQYHPINFISTFTDHTQPKQNYFLIITSIIQKIKLGTSELNESALLNIFHWLKKKFLCENLWESQQISSLLLHERLL